MSKATFTPVQPGYVLAIEDSEDKWVIFPMFGWTETDGHIVPEVSRKFSERLELSQGAPVLGNYKVLYSMDLFRRTQFAARRATTKELTGSLSFEMLKDAHV